MAVVTRKGDLVGVVGCRFHPTDEELVNYYLKRKNQGRDHDVGGIALVNVCKFEPWDLPGQSKIKSSDSVWYFFSPREYKYKKSKRSNRTTDAGYWKLTGKPRKVMSKRKQIGIKRTLVFYNGRPKGVKTKWIMHQYEYAPDSNSQEQGNFVLCKIRRKSNEKTGEGEPLPSDSQNQNPAEMATTSFCDEYQTAHHMAYDAENQCPNDVTAASTDANGDTSHSVASDNENRVSMVTPDFNYQLPYMGGDFLSISSLENLPTFREGECPPTVTPTDSDQSANEKCNWPFVSDFKNQILACGEVKLPYKTMYFDLENESPNLEGDSPITSCYREQISAFGEGELPPLVISCDFRSELPCEKGDYLFNSDLKNQLLDIDFEEGAQNPIVGAPSEDCLNASYLGNQIYDVESEAGQEISHIPVPSWYEDQSTLNKGERHSLLAYDFRNINSDDKINISVSGEGESSSLKMTPSDFASQNQFQKIDMQNLEDVDEHSVMDFGVETTNAELDKEWMAYLAAELQCTLNSDLQGPRFDDETPLIQG